MANITILGRKVKSIEVYKRFNWGTKREETTGFIWLEGFRIRIIGKAFFILYPIGNAIGYIGKATKAYKKIKRLISRKLANYRKNGNAQHVSYWRQRALDGQYNICLFLMSGIPFKGNETNFIKIAA